MILSVNYARPAYSPIVLDGKKCNANGKDRTKQRAKGVAKCTVLVGVLQHLRQHQHTNAVSDEKFQLSLWHRCD
jgi:hypothetical protein